MNSVSKKKKVHEDHFDVFITYRREGGSSIARFLEHRLQSECGLHCFFDRKSIKSAPFDEKIKQSIKYSENYIVIVTPEMFSTDRGDNDWVVKEILWAVQCGKLEDGRFFPIFVNGADSWPKNAPPEISDGMIGKSNGWHLKHDNFDEEFARLVEALVTKKHRLASAYKETVMKYYDRASVFDLLTGAIKNIDNMGDQARSDRAFNGLLSLIRSEWRQSNYSDDVGMTILEGLDSYELSKLVLLLSNSADKAPNSNDDVSDGVVEFLDNFIGGPELLRKSILDWSNGKGKVIVPYVGEVNRRDQLANALMKVLTKDDVISIRDALIFANDYRMANLQENVKRISDIGYMLRVCNYVEEVISHPAIKAPQLKSVLSELQRSNQAEFDFIERKYDRIIKSDTWLHAKGKYERNDKRYDKKEGEEQQKSKKRNVMLISAFVNCADLVFADVN